MLSTLTDTLVHTIESNVWLAPLAAMFGGILTAANPCVIATVPLMMAYVAGQASGSRVLRSFLLSLVFAVGLTTTFAVMFLATWAASSVLRAGWWTYVAAAVCLLMGLHLLNVIQVHIPAPPGMRPAQRGFIGALLLGLLFGLISLPCAGPILLVLLTLIPVKGAVFGGVLLIAYSLGHCVLILAAGTSMGLVQRVLSSSRIHQANEWSKRAAGLLVITVGVFLLVQ